MMTLAAILPPHPHRADVLSACALVARTRAPMAEGLERLAAGDPLLMRWARRLAPPLRAGAPLAETLRRERLLTRREAELLALDGDAPGALDRIAAGALAPPRGLLLVRHLPVALALALMLPALAVSIVLDLIGAHYETIYRELGIMLPYVTEVTLGVVRLLFSTVLLTAAAFAAEALLRSLRGFRHIAHLWCPEVERESALLRLVESARLRDERSAQVGTLWMALAPVTVLLNLVRLNAVRRGRPAWDLDWRTWLFLSRYRLDREQRRAAAAQPDLAARLIGLGVVELIDGRPDWDGAERRCRARLEMAVSETLLLARPVLLLFVWSSLVTAGIGVMLPLFKILVELGRMT
jgi:hypothetical protein